MTGLEKKDHCPENIIARRSCWVSWSVVALAFLLAATLSWRRWADALVDFGMQLYLPWRISQGDAIYRTVMYLPGGPLSQHFNALLFRIFGVSFQTLIFANLTITAGLVFFIYQRFLRVSDRLTATMIGLGIVMVFAFGHYTIIGNYNYVTPYAHEVFHGMALSIVAVAWIADWIEKGKIRFAAAVGFISGLVFMTKPEVFLALAASILTAFFIGFWRAQHHRFLARSLGVLLAAGLVPLLAFFGFFLWREDWHTSLRSVCFAWVPLMHTSIGKNPYYQWCLGLDAAQLHLEKMAVYVVSTVFTIAIFAVVFQRTAKAEFKFYRLFWLALPMLGWAAFGNWLDCGRVLPFLALTACVLIVLDDDQITTGRMAILPLLWNIFGLALLAKMGVFTRIWHYGFALAMPAFVGGVYFLAWLLPSWLERKWQVRRDWLCATICMILTTGYIRLFLFSEINYSQKITPICAGGDELMTYPPSINPFHEHVQVALAWIQTNTPPEATLAVLPEGAMINYLSRRVNSTKFPVWLPPEMDMFGQTDMTADFEINSPDYIVILERSTVEYGVGFFGYYPQYGTSLKQWIDEHYDRVYPAAKSNNPDHKRFSALEILKRRPAGVKN